jgi:hypothetical protein
MADNVNTLPSTDPSAVPVATDDVAGVQYQRVKLDKGGDGVSSPITSANPLDVAIAGTVPVSIAAAVPVTGPVTDAQLRATALPVSGPLTDAQLRATALPVSIAAPTALTDTQLRATPVAVSGPLTDAQLRATAVTVTGVVASTGLTDAQLRASAVPVSGPLTDTQLRATAVPVSGTVATGGLTDVQLRATAVPISISNPTALTDTQLRATAVPVSGPLTDAQLRATALPVSAAALPLPAGAATETTLAALNTKTPAVGAALGAASSPVVLSAETATGTITTQNLVPNGAATAGSAVEITLNGAAIVSIQVTGVYTGALSLQLTNDNARWETITFPALVNAITGVGAGTIATATVGVFLANVSGFLKARLSGLAAMTGTATVTMRSAPVSTHQEVYQPTAANLNVTASLAAAQTLATVTTVTTVSTLAGIAAGVNLIADVGLQARANATGAGSVSKVTAAVSTNATLIKAGAGRVLGYLLTNLSAAARFVRMHNLNVAPTVGTSVPTYVIAIPAGQTVEMSDPVGIAHASGISYSITAAAADLDTTVTAANDVIGHIRFS